MFFKRKHYLDLLVNGIGNGLVKIVTGGRRCGKSFLLFHIFHNYLLESGVAVDHIIELSLDDRRCREFRNPDALLDYIDAHVMADGETHYVILDEVQYVENFVEVLLSLLHTPKLEVYVSGSNSKFLSKDIVTEFRGRGQEIRVWPLTFSEYYGAVGGNRDDAWKLYYTYGGMPQVLLMNTPQQMKEYLKNVFELTYIKDIVERNNLRGADGLLQVVRVLASTIGSSTNPKRLSNTFRSAAGLTVADKTIKEYIVFLQDAFLMEEALRFDVKGRRYIGTETKYYFCDLGLRAAALNFRQQEETHIMENIIYNELRSRGCLVDVGLVDAWGTDAGGKCVRQQLEVDFVVNNGADRVYIQSAFRMPTCEKEEQEQRSLLRIGDNFKKIIIVWDNIMPKVSEHGIITMGLLDFLLDKESLVRPVL